jgi:hypothetical protein
MASNRKSESTLLLYFAPYLKDNVKTRKQSAKANNLVINVKPESV